jgi:putative PIN family toxin of toxin-antitoxin system
VRVVLDANVLISAALSPRGTPAELIRRWGAGEFELIVSEQLLAKVGRALRTTKLRRRIPESATRDILLTLRDQAIVAPDACNAVQRAADPDDDYLIALAESHNAVLVSGDRHLLELADSLPIRSPKDFLQLLD